MTPSTPRPRTRNNATISDIAPGRLYPTSTVAVLFSRTGDTIRNWVAGGIITATRLANCDRLFFLGADILKLWASLGFDQPPADPPIVTPAQEKKRHKAAMKKMAETQKRVREALRLRQKAGASQPSKN